MSVLALVLCAAQVRAIVAPGAVAPADDGRQASIVEELVDPASGIPRDLEGLRAGMRGVLKTWPPLMGAALGGNFERVAGRIGELQDAWQGLSPENREKLEPAVRRTVEDYNQIARAQTGLKSLCGEIDAMAARPEKQDPAQAARMLERLDQVTADVGLEATERNGLHEAYRSPLASFPKNPEERRDTRRAFQNEMKKFEGTGMEPLKSAARLNTREGLDKTFDNAAIGRGPADGGGSATPRIAGDVPVIENTAKTARAARAVQDVRVPGKPGEEGATLREKAVAALDDNILRRQELNRLNEAGVEKQCADGGSWFQCQKFKAARGFNNAMIGLDAMGKEWIKDPKEAAKFAYEMTPAADVHNLIKDPSMAAAGAVAVGMIPGGKLVKAFEHGGEAALDAAKAGKIAQEAAGIRKPALLESKSFESTGNRMERYDFGDGATAKILQGNGYIEVKPDARGRGREVYEFARDLARERNVQLRSDPLGSLTKGSASRWEKMVAEGKAYLDKSQGRFIAILE